VNLNDVVEFLRVASAYDPFLARKDPTDAANNVKMWHKILDSSMTLETAFALVTKHYESSAKTVTAADLNALYRIQKRQEIEQQLELDRQQQLEQAQNQSPEDRERIREMIRRVLKGDEPGEVDGKNKTN